MDSRLCKEIRHTRSINSTYLAIKISLTSRYNLLKPNKRLSERFKTILTQQTELKAKRAELEQQQAEDAELTSHMELAADTLEQAGTAITEWDEYQIRALVESVRILSKEEILVRLKSGIEKVEKLRVG